MTKSRVPFRNNDNGDKPQWSWVRIGEALLIAALSALAVSVVGWLFLLQDVKHSVDTLHSLAEQEHTWLEAKIEANQRNTLENARLIGEQKLETTKQEERLNYLQAEINRVQREIRDAN